MDWETNKLWERDTTNGNMLNRKTINLWKLRNYNIVKLGNYKTFELCRTPTPGITSATEDKAGPSPPWNRLRTGARKSDTKI